MPFLAPCQAKTKEKNEWKLPVVFIAATYILENLNGYIKQQPFYNHILIVNLITRYNKKENKRERMNPSISYVEKTYSLYLVFKANHISSILNIMIVCLLYKHQNN